MNAAITRLTITIGKELTTHHATYNKIARYSSSAHFGNIRHTCYYLAVLRSKYARLPDIPKAIISIPLTRNAIEIKIPNRTNPNEIGCAITRIDTMILTSPTPMRNALEERDALLDILCIILAIPLKSRATAARTTRIADANIWNCISMIEKAIIARPSTILAKLDPLKEGRNAIPTDILSIPTASKITERIKILVNIAGPMYAKINRDNVMHSPPKTI
jgi:hypothetical protein